MVLIAILVLGVPVLLYVAGVIFLSRRAEGMDPRLAAAFNTLLPGLGYAYLETWTRLIAFWVISAGLVFLLNPRYLILSVFGFWAISIFDAFFIGKARRRAQTFPSPTSDSARDTT